MVNILLYNTVSFFENFEKNLHILCPFMLYLKLRTIIITVTVQLAKSGNVTLIQYYHLTYRAYSNFIIISTNEQDHTRHMDFCLVSFNLEPLLSFNDLHDVGMFEEHGPSLL